MRYLSLTLLPLLVVACSDQSPVAPDTSPLFAKQGVNKQAISGEMDNSMLVSTGKTHITPSGICHYWDVEVSAEFVRGDLSGTITFFEKQNLRCDFTHVAASGPFEAEVTWDGLSGSISGQWTTECRVDPSLGGLSCDGTMNGHGSGDLEGIHFKWGPGWWPFPYTGTVFYK